MVVLGWLVCLGLEAAFLAWALGRWPGLGASLADLSFAMALIPAVLLAPVCEELLFRGVLCEGLSRRYGNLIGIAASAALFALAHWHWLRLPGCFAFGMLTGVLQRRTGSILPCIAIHAGHNALAALGAHHLGWAETLWGLLCAGALAVLVESCRKQPSGRARPRSS
jgi:membrane protease YdiL (CAAX protease family)